LQSVKRLYGSINLNFRSGNRQRNNSLENAPVSIAFCNNRVSNLFLVCPLAVKNPKIKNPINKYFINNIKRFFHFYIIGQNNHPASVQRLCPLIQNEGNIEVGTSPAQVIEVKSHSPAFRAARTCNGKHGGAFRAMRPYLLTLPVILQIENKTCYPCYQ
jgi:hypothetical protein